MDIVAPLRLSGIVGLLLALVRLSFLQLSSAVESEPTICRYLIQKTYECEVPRPCNGTSLTTCKEIVHGTWSDADDIVHYHDVCIFTDHFSTCTFLPDLTFKCQMQWEQRRHPSGHYTGNAHSGFRRVDPANGDSKRAQSTSNVDLKTVKSSRLKRAGGGTC